MERNKSHFWCLTYYFSYELNVLDQAICGNGSCSLGAVGKMTVGAMFAISSEKPWMMS
jgi:hypothetical protein